MTTSLDLWIIIPMAWFLDWCLGDPAFLPHPVIWMGKAIEKGERVFRKMVPSPFTAGLLMAVSLVGGVWGISFLAVRAAWILHPLAGILLEVVLLFYCFSVRSLDQAASAVQSTLEKQGIEAARAKVSMIVGREVDKLDEAGVTRAAVETVAENFVDGFFSPLFYACLGGAPMAMAYKMVNTLDSMVGYRNERYIDFGKASARIDDLANLIPARLSVIVIAAAAMILENARRGVIVIKTGFSQGRLHKSPNSGFSEAAFSGALEVRLGGPNYYHGTLVDKPFIGSRYPDPVCHDILKACQLMVFSSLISMIAASVILYLNRAVVFYFMG